MWVLAGTGILWMCARLKIPFPPLTSHVSSQLLPEAGMGSGPYIPSANVTVPLRH